jgi:hypothetical protein
MHVSIVNGHKEKQALPDQWLTYFHLRGPMREEEGYENRVCLVGPYVYKSAVIRLCPSVMSKAGQ